MSRPNAQKTFVEKRRAEGLCVDCGLPRTNYSHRCDRCQKDARERERARVGARKWRPGGPGRPPKVR